MYVSYDHYHVFYYVAKYESISQAAKVLLSNQPNVTRIIKSLEGQLGCPLFSRTNRGMRLTPEGERLYSHIRVAFEQINAAEAEIEENRNLKNGSVYVAASEVALHCLLLPILKQYRSLYPGVSIKVSNHSSPQALAALKDGLADIAVVTTPFNDTSSLSVRRIKSVNEVAICGKSFKELIDRKVSFAALQSFPLISLGPDTGTYRFYSKLFAEYGLSFSPDIEAATSDQIKPMVESDLGIGFIPVQFVRDGDEICKINLEQPIPTRDICIVKKREQPLSVAAKELERLICGS